MSSKMNCRVIQDLLPLYVDDVVSAESRLLVESHLSECEDCKKQYKEMTSGIILPVDSGIRKEDALRLENHFKKDTRKKRCGKIAGIILTVLVCAVILSGIIWFRPFHPFPDADAGEGYIMVESIVSGTSGGVYAQNAKSQIEKILPQIRVRRVFHARSTYEIPSDTISLSLFDGTRYLDCSMEPDEKVYLYATEGSVVAYEVLNPELLKEAVSGMDQYPGDDDYDFILDLYLAYPNSLSTNLSAYTPEEVEEWKTYLKSIFTDDGQREFGFDEQSRWGERFRYENAARKAGGMLQYSDVIWEWDGKKLHWETEVTWLAPAEYGWPQSFPVTGIMYLDENGKIAHLKLESDNGLMDVIDTVIQSL